MVGEYGQTGLGNRSKRPLPIDYGRRGETQNTQKHAIAQTYTRELNARTRGYSELPCPDTQDATRTRHVTSKTRPTSARTRLAIPPAPSVDRPREDCPPTAFETAHTVCAHVDVPAAHGARRGSA